MKKTKIIRITTVPISLNILLKGQLNYIANNGFEVLGVSSPGKELEEVAKNEGIDVAELSMTRTINLFRDIRSLWLFYRMCRRERPTIVHSHTPKAGIVGMLGARLAGVPIRLHDVAGLPLMEAKGIKRCLLNFVEKLTYRCATRVYPNSKGLVDFILKNNFTSKEKLFFLSNGSSNGINTVQYDSILLCSEQQYLFKQSLKMMPNDFVFIFVGRLVGDKGINELIQAFSNLNLLNTKLLLVGPMESQLDPLKSDTIEIIKLNPNIISVGFQEDVRPFLAISNCLVFPSYREGFPNVVMQAGAMGLPSIVTDINGCNEIIIEGENGTIIPSKNVIALKDAMFKMYNDKEWRVKLSANARYLITSRYEQKVVWEALIKEYNSILVKYESNL
jgi:glycosyltransferase involved in cell wall biosynthesis